MPPGWFGTRGTRRGVRLRSWRGRLAAGVYVLLVVVLAMMLAARHVGLFLMALAVLTAAYVLFAI